MGRIIRLCVVSFDPNNSISFRCLQCYISEVSLFLHNLGKLFTLANVKISHITGRRMYKSHTLKILTSENSKVKNKWVCVNVIPTNGKELKAERRQQIPSFSMFVLPLIYLQKRYSELNNQSSIHKTSHDIKSLHEDSEAHTRANCL